MAVILVIGDDLRAFLATVRSLGRAGHTLHALVDRCGSAALESRYITECHVTAPQYASVSHWLQTITNLDDAIKFDWIFPCTDQALLPFLFHDHPLDPGKIIHPGKKAFKAFYDKVKTHQLADKLDIPMPKWFPVDAIGGDYPQYLKPRSSVTLKYLSRKQEVTRIDSANQLMRCLEGIGEKAASAYFLEEHAAGTGVGVSILADNGIVTHAFQHQRLAEGVAGGSSVRQSVLLHSGMLDAAVKLALKTKLNGLAMVEFRYNTLTDQFFLLEVNARVWGSLPLAIHAGIDFPALLIDQLERQKKGHTADQQDQKNLPAYKKGKIGRALTPSLYDFRRKITHYSLIGKIGATLLALIKSIGRQVIGSEKIDSFSWRDPMPFMHEIGQQTSVVYKKLGQMTGVWQWFSARRSARFLAQHKSQIKNILVLCYGNICRSPFMASCLREELEGTDILIESAGFHMPEGRPSPKTAIKTANTEGHDLTAHRSRFVTKAMVDDADLILYFDDRNHSDIAAFFPEALSKSFNAGYFLDMRYDIVDPFDQPKKVYKKCYRRISIASQVVADGLIGEARHEPD